MTAASPTDLDLTAARIRRASLRTMGPAINKETAREDAAIVHDIIACVRRAFAIEPTHLCWCGDESAVIEAILRAVAGFQPRDHDHNDACHECEELALYLVDVERLTGAVDLYEKLLRVCGHVRNEDYSWVFEDERPSDDPSVDGVTFEEEVILEDNDDSNGHHQRARRGRPHLQLVGGPEVINADDLDRTFLQLIGGFEQTSGNDRPRLTIMKDPELPSADDLTRLFLTLMKDPS